MELRGRLCLSRLLPRRSQNCLICVLLGKCCVRSASELRVTVNILSTFSSYQVGRRRGDQDRRYLFRGWSRLYLHAASLAAAEEASALVAVASTASRVSTTSAVDPAVNLEARGGRRGTDSEQHSSEAENGNGLAGHRLRQQRIIHASKKVGKTRASETIGKGRTS